jgi:hypothetical protein
LTWREAQRVLDEELTRLPERYRAPLVLCYLEGKTRDEAARQLGWSLGQLRGRLNRGRARLRVRLARRGVTLAVALSSSLLPEHTLQASMVVLMKETMRAALQVASGGTTGLVSVRVLTLMKGGIQAMFLSKLKIVAALVLALSMLTTGAGLLVHQSLAGKPSDVQVSAPVAKAKPIAAPQPPADDLQKQCRMALAKGVAYLKAQQKEGNWEHLAPGAGVSYAAGSSSLVLLALLEAGVDPRDEAIAKGLEYLRSRRPKPEERDTYVVALQTAVFAKARPEKDRLLIRENVDWLIKAMQRDAQGRLKGWSYKQSDGFTDNSNTQFAVMALHAASQADIKTDPQLWKEIRDYYVRTQLPDGGWGYRLEGFAEKASRFTMTCAGVCGLAITSKELNEVGGEPLAKGLAMIGDNFTVSSRMWQYYALYGIARTGRLTGTEIFEGPQKQAKHAWYRTGAQSLLQQQNADGSWKGKSPNLLDGHPTIATSFALLFLAAGK